MATSQVKILNQALYDIGGSPITAIDEGTTVSNVCQDIWEPILEEVLEEHTWDFAKKWAYLAIDAGYSNLDEVFTYAYALPSDYIRMSKMEDRKTIYEIRGLNLMTNVEDALIEYIWKEENVTRFPPHFRYALISRLRVSLSIQVAGKAAKKIDWVEMYRSVDLPSAKARDAMGSKPTQANETRHTDTTDTWLAAR